MTERLPPPASSPFQTVWQTVTSHVRGPLGCLVAIVLLPFVLLGMLIAVVVMVVKARRLVRSVRAAQMQAGGGFGRGTGAWGAAGAGGGAGGADAAARMLVGKMAVEESFTAEEALQAGTLASAGLSPADVLETAVARGWVVRRGDGRLAVTARGRDASSADDFRG